MREIRRSALAAAAMLAVMMTVALAGEEKKTDSVSEAEKKVRDLAEQLHKARTAALKELAEAEKKAHAALDMANEQFRKARGDRDASTKAREAINKAMADIRQIQSSRSAIHRSHGFALAIAAVSVREEDRLGARFGPASATLTKQLGLEEGTGMVIERVAADSAAAKAGLQEHDVLTHLDGKTVPGNTSEFRKLLGGIKAGAAVDAAVLRAGKKQTITGLTLPAAAERTTISIRPSTGTVIQKKTGPSVEPKNKSDKE